MKQSIFFLFLFLFIFIIGGQLSLRGLVDSFRGNSQEETASANIRHATLLVLARAKREKLQKLKNETAATTTVVLDIPFLAQAPLGSWADPRLQSACEETSILMTMLWIRQQTLAPADAEQEIFRMVEFEKETYGQWYDTSARDSVKIFSDYFGYAGVEVKEVISVGDIIEALRRGRAVIVPVNGQKLKNPYYTPPGPLRHMLVIRGYDQKTREFITNDPGTRRGNGLRYKETILEAALQDYSTGYHEPMKDKKTAMIVIPPRVLP